MERLKRNLMIAAAAIIVGAFLPWAEVLWMSVKGTAGDGQITLVCGVIILVLALQEKLTGVTAFLIVLLGGGTTYLAGYYITRLSEDIDDMASVGVGLFLTLAGGIAAVILGFKVSSEWKRPAAGAADAGTTPPAQTRTEDAPQ